MAKIKDNTADVLGEADKLISQKLKTSALMVERSAKQECPVLTGTAKRSILSNWYGAKGSRGFSWPTSTQIVKGKKVYIKAGETVIGSQTKKSAIIGSNIEYFPHIELGTSKMAAKSPLRRALEMNMIEIRRLFATK